MEVVEEEAVEPALPIAMMNLGQNITATTTIDMVVATGNTEHFSKSIAKILATIVNQVSSPHVFHLNYE